MTRYIARFFKGGFPELYAVMDTKDHSLVGEPKPYHEANDEAGARNAGTWGKPEPAVEHDWSISPAFSAWLPGTFIRY